MFINKRFADGDRPIVVGIDGSPAALRALSWGVHEAHARECPLVVVHAWGNVPLPGAMFTSANERRRASECFVANQVAAATGTSTTSGHHRGQHQGTGRSRPHRARP